MQENSGTGTEWLELAGIQSEIYYLINENESPLLPEWFAFLIWLGAWMRKKQIDNGRIVCAVLLPTRRCCASFCAFGALMDALLNPHRSITWKNFLACPNETPVYLLCPEKNNPNKRKQVEGVLKEVVRYGTEMFRKIQIINGGRRYENLTIIVKNCGFKDYKISLKPHYGGRLINALSELSVFFSKMVPEFNEDFLLISEPESMVITNRAAWHRENEDIVLVPPVSNVQASYNMAELLMISHHRTILMSPKTRDIDNFSPPLAILDGLDSMRSWEMSKARNMIIMLDRVEYDEEAENLLHDFSNYSIEMPTIFNDVPRIFPQGIEAGFYVFKGD